MEKYVIEFEKGVYAAIWEGDPGRTLKIENAKLFSSEKKAKKELRKIIEEIKHYRNYSDAKVISINQR